MKRYNYVFFLALQERKRLLYEIFEINQQILELRKEDEARAMREFIERWETSQRGRT